MRQVFVYAVRDLKMVDAINSVFRQLLFARLMDHGYEHELVVSAIVVFVEL